MTEKQFKEILKTLKIGFNKSNVEIKELLDVKLNEYLDRQDEGAEEMVSDIQDALDYVEERIAKMGGGIALFSEESDHREASEEINRELLGEAAKNGRKGPAVFVNPAAAGGNSHTANGAQATASSAAGGGNSKEKPWFYSIKGDSSVNDMFELAEEDLRIGDFSHAISVFDTILKNEMTNPGAYMGRVLAIYKLKEPKDIATCYTGGLEKEPDLKRAENSGNPKQKKFIQDALEDRRKAMIYMGAAKVLNTSNDMFQLLDAAKKFDSLGFYRDAAERADECRKIVDEIKARDNRIRNAEKRRKIKKAIAIALAAGILGMVLNYTVIDWVRAQRFGDVYIEGNQQDQAVEDSPFVKSVTIENAADVYIENCRGLKEVTVKEADRVNISASENTKKIKVDSVDDLAIQGWGDKVKMETIEVSNIQKAKISSGYKVGEWKLGEGIKKLELYACDELSGVTIGKDVTDMTFNLCNGFDGMSFEAGFSGEITYDQCDVEKIYVPAAASAINVKICHSLKDFRLEDGFSGSVSIEDAGDIGSIFVPKDTKSVFLRACPSLTSVTFEDGFAGDIHVELCDSLTAGNFAIPNAARNVSIRFCSNLEDYSRQAGE